MDNTNQLQLPYKEITAVMGRKYYRDNFAISSKESYKIPIDQIQVRDGYNKRNVYDDMESVVEWVKKSTTDGIVELDPLPVIEATDEGEIFILRGHRRLKGIHMAISEGLKVDFVVCTPAPKDITELDRVLDIYTSNMHQSKLKPLEQAQVAFDAKNNFGSISNEEIAAKMHCSRQQVDNLLILASADDATKQEILNGNLGITEAVKYIRSLKKAQKDADQSELDANKNPSAAPQEPKDALANDIKDLAALEQETDEERDQRLLRENTKREQELEQLMEISDEIKVKPETLPEHLGRKLSAPVLRGWVEDFIDEDTAEVVSINRNEVIVNKNEIITDEVMATILEMDGVDTILVYKKGMEPVAKSVVTVLPGGDDDSVKYDLDRIEIQQIQNVIKNFDKLSGIVSRIDCCPEQTKTDVEKLVEWTQRDLAEIRTWIHKNKKQNKAR